ncbi:MAG: MOSC domain-containing protein [Anaerolineae bacterium]|nr:MOSC domain-containing protein [Anaerolineae bacterium]
MKKIGTVKQVQVQQSSLKAGEKPNQYYDPAPLLVVDALHLTAAGVTGLTMDGSQIVDVHNATHPASRNGGDNGVSVGFTSHYRAMRDQFGTHLVDGIAGENILVESDHRWRLDELGARLAFENPETGALVYLDALMPAPPCVPFSQFALQAAAGGDTIKAALQFLHEGTRGFYATAHQPGSVQPGDVVYILA